LGEETDLNRGLAIEHEVADQEPMVAFQRIIQGDHIPGFGYLIENRIARDGGRVAIVRNALGDDADNPMLAGIVLLKTKFYPVEAVGFQHDGASVPFAEEAVMDGGGKDEIAVGDKKEFGSVVRVVRDIGIPEHIGLSIGFDEQMRGVAMKFKRGILPEQWPRQEGEVEGIIVLCLRPGQRKKTQDETEKEWGAGEGPGSHDGNFWGIEILWKIKKYSSGINFFRRVKGMVRRISFFGGIEYSIFVSATKEIQSNPEQPKESKICKPDPKSLKTKKKSTYPAKKIYSKSLKRPESRET
jgi:hypothetical protein